MIIFCCINLSAMCNLALKRFFFTEKSKAIIAQLNEAHAKSSYPSYVRLFSPY